MPEKVSQPSILLAIIMMRFPKKMQNSFHNSLVKFAKDGLVEGKKRNDRFLSQIDSIAIMSCNVWFRL